MKKYLCLILFLFVLGVPVISAQNPIPSYNVPVYHIACFQEQYKSKKSIRSTMGKRAMVIRATGSTSSIATVYVYSLDEQTILGPYTIYGGDILSVEIDSREWGIVVESDDHITVDVWINEFAK